MNQEQSLKRLEAISAELSNPDLDVQSALSLFEEGVEIVKQNYEEIKQANGRIFELKKELDKYSEIKFDEE